MKNRVKMIIASLMSVLMVAGMSIAAFAEETGAADTAVVAAMQTGVNAVKGDFMSMLAVVLPVGLVIAGVGIAIKLGWGLFKKVGK